MNKKLKIILFSLSLVGLLNNGTIFSVVDMTRYNSMCDEICTLAKEHPTITAATTLIAIALMAPTIYKGAKKTTKAVRKHPKKATLLAILPALYYLDKYCQEEKFVGWLVEKYNEFLVSSPGIKIRGALGWTDDQFLKFVNWLSPQIQKRKRVRKVDESGEELEEKPVLYEEEEEEEELEINDKKDQQPTTTQDEKEEQEIKGVNSNPKVTPLSDNRERSIIVTDNIPSQK